MRLCANENVSGETVGCLRAAGHDVVWIREAAPGSPDQAVLELARKDGRLLLTFDKDFGELVYRQGLAASNGIVLFRMAQSSAMAVAERICAILQGRTDWAGQYSVVGDSTVRMRPLPAN
jgi:predicted nuclease of predicted toxin-antitoxin system